MNQPNRSNQVRHLLADGEALSAHEMAEKAGDLSLVDRLSKAARRLRANGEVETIRQPKGPPKYRQAETMAKPVEDDGGPIRRLVRVPPPKPKAVIAGPVYVAPDLPLVVRPLQVPRPGSYQSRDGGYVSIGPDIRSRVAETQE